MLGVVQRGSLGFDHNRIEVGYRLHYRPIEQDRFRQRISPVRSWSVRSRQIPQEAFAFAAIGVQRAADFHLFDSRGDEMIGVPELPHAAIGKTPKRHRSWRTPVTREDRFPNREHHDRAFRVLAQNFFDCGGPPQTSWSSWRE